MRNTLIIHILLLIPLLGLSQINRSIDFINGIDYSYRSLKTSSSDDIMTFIIEGRNEREIPKFNARIGVNYNQRISNNLFLKSGLRYTTFGYKLKLMNDLQFPNQHDGMGGHIPVDETITRIQLFHNYHLIEVPFALRYELNKKKIKPFIETGISPSIFITEQTISRTNEGRSVSYSQGVVTPFNKFHLFGFFSLGLNYSNNNNYQFFLQPTFRYQFYYKDLVNAPIKERLYNGGIEFGVRKRIK